METYCSYDKMIDLSELEPHPRNPNTHPPQQITALAKIMTENGVRMPIVVSKRSGHITKGHGRRLAAMEAGFTEYPVDYQEYESDEAELADMLADNVIAEFSIMDDMLKADIQASLILSDFDLEIAGVLGNDIGSPPMDEENTVLPSVMQVYVECDSPEMQSMVYQYLAEGGYDPQVKTL